jgi:hypothetical protein
MVERANAHGLTYLGDAAPTIMFASNYGDEIAEPLLKECGHSQVLLEQYLDFVVSQTFRRTLLVRAEHGPQIRYQLDRGLYGRLHFAAWLPPVGAQTRLDDSRQEYGADGWTLFTQDPAAKAALDALNERWPWTLSRKELGDAVHARLDASGVDAGLDSGSRIDDLLDFLIVAGRVRYRLDPVGPEASVSPLLLDPRLRRMAEMARADSEALIFNRWHETLPLSAVDRHLLPLLDGTRDRTELVEALVAITRVDPGMVSQAGDSPPSESDLRAAFAAHIDATPERLLGLKLL